MKILVKNSSLGWKVGLKTFQECGAYKQSTCLFQIFDLFYDSTSSATSSAWGRPITNSICGIPKIWNSPLAETKTGSRNHDYRFRLFFDWAFDNLCLFLAVALNLVFCKYAI